MNDSLLDRHKNDPAWAEVIRLHSGLLDTQDAREIFILDLAQTNVLLAAECKTSSIEEEQKLTEKLVIIAEKQAKIFEEEESSAKGLSALVELGEDKKVLEILQNVQNPVEKHKVVIEALIRQVDTDRALDILLLLSNIQVKQISLFIWANRFFDKELLHRQHRVKIIEIVKKALNRTDEVSLKSIETLIATCNQQDGNLIVELIEKVIQRDNSLKSFRLVEKWVVKCQLQNKLPIEKLIKKNGIGDFKLAEEWIAKYKLQDKFPIERLIQVLIKNSRVDDFNLATGWIEKYHLQNKFPIVELIVGLIKNNRINNSKLVQEWVVKYWLQTKFSFERLIEELIKENGIDDFRLAEELIEEYQLLAKFPSEGLIERLLKELIKNNSIDDFRLAEELIAKYRLQTQFPIEVLIGELIKKNGTDNFSLSEEWMGKYQVRNKFILAELIGELIKQNGTDGFNLEEEWIAKYQLQNKFLPTELIRELIKQNGTEDFNLLEELIIKYQRQNKFCENFIMIKDKLGGDRTFSLAKNINITIPLTVFIEQMTKGDRNELFLAREIFLDKKQEDIYTKDILEKKYEEKYILSFRKWLDDLFAEKINKDDNRQLKTYKSKLKIGSYVVCTVKCLDADIVFVDIEGDKRSASIEKKYLLEKFIPDITQFEYNGERLHIGQKLVAKIIKIDEQNKINLSLLQ